MTRFADGPAGAALFDRPWGMALDARRQRHRRRLTEPRDSAASPPDGSVTTIAGGNGRGARDGESAVRRSSPSRRGVCSRRCGGSSSWRTPKGNRIRRISPECTVTTVAGGGPVYDLNEHNVGGHRDGPGAQARFREPTDLVFDSRRQPAHPRTGQQPDSHALSGWRCLYDRRRDSAAARGRGDR